MISRHQLAFCRVILFLLSLILSLLLQPAQAALPSFSVAPGRLIVPLDHVRTETFLIRNTGQQRIHIRIEPIFYPLNSRALQGGVPLPGNHEKAASLVPYLLVSPQALSLQGGEEREIRVSIRPPGNLLPGTYRGHVLVHMMEVARVANQKSRNAAGKQIGTQLNLLLEMGVVVYGNKGHGKPTLRVQCTRDAKHHLILSVINPSHWHYSGLISVYPNANTQKPLARHYQVVYRQSRAKIPFHLMVKPKETLYITWAAYTDLHPIEGQLEHAICHVHS